MTHLRKEMPSGVEIPKASDLAAQGPVLLPLVQDFQDTWLDFHTKTFRPALSMMRQGMQKGWTQGINRFKSFWEQARHSKNPFAAKPVSRQQKLTETLNLYRVQGALGYRWTFPDDESPIRIIPGKENPWLSGHTRISKVGKTYQTRQQLRMVNRQPESIESETDKGQVTPITKAASKAPTTSDEIRGLDDIFTEPVQTSFLDVVAPKGKKSATKGKVNASLPKTDLVLDSPILNEAEASEQSQVLPSESIAAQVVPYVLPAVGEPVPENVSADKLKVGNAATPEAVQTFETSDTRESEVSGCEWMVRSNRILSRSITNLVDQYFEQSAREEER